MREDDRYGKAEMGRAGLKERERNRREVGGSKERARPADPTWLAILLAANRKISDGRTLNHSLSTSNPCIHASKQSDGLQNQSNVTLWCPDHNVHSSAL
jgi:hypothetical protein